MKRASPHLLGLVGLVGLAAAASCTASESPSANTGTPGPGTAGGSTPTSGGGTTSGSGNGSSGTGPETTPGGGTASSPASGSGGSSGPVSGSGGASVGGGPTGSAGAPSCSIGLTPVAPTSFDGLVAGADARVRIQATVVGGTRAPRWMWMVSFAPDLSATIPVTAVSDPAIVEFPITAPGVYSIQVVADVGPSCFADLSITVQPPEKNVLVFSVTPPDALSPTIPPQKLKRMVTGTAPPPLALALQGGSAVRILPEGADGTSLTSYVRVHGLSFSTVVEGYTDRGPLSAVLLPYPTEVYEVLVIPDATVAPQLFGNGDLLGDAQRLVVLPMEPGTTVTGTATTASGAPVTGVRVVLHSGDRPSTVGTTGADGSYSLLTRAGTHSMVFSPPLDSGLPEIHVPTEPGVTVPSSDVSISASAVWGAFSAAPVTIHARSADGASDLAGAWVRLESAQELPGVATVALRGSSSSNPPVPPAMAGAPTPTTTLTASGSVRVDATTDAGGLARFAAVPAGAYTLTVVPPNGMSQVAMPARIPITIPVGGLTSTVAVPGPVALSGRLLPSAGTPGMRVVARDQTDVLPVDPIAATVDASGSYSLSLPPSRVYRLEADPLGVAGFARTILGTIALGSQDLAAPDFQMGIGVALAGTLTGPSPDPQQTAPMAMGGALIQVFCPSVSPTCPAPDQPVAEVATRADGTFLVFVPAALLQP